MNLINKIIITIIVIVIFYAIFLIYSDLNLVKDHLDEFKIEFLPYIAGLTILGWFVIFYRNEKGYKYILNMILHV